MWDTTTVPVGTWYWSASAIGSDEAAGWSPYASPRTISVTPYLPPPICTDECVEFSHECVLGEERTCWDLNGDGCAEWTGWVSCPLGMCDGDVCALSFCSNDILEA